MDDRFHIARLVRIFSLLDSCLGPHGGVTEQKVPRPLLDEAAAALRASRSFSDRILIVKIWRDLEKKKKKTEL